MPVPPTSFRAAYSVPAANPASAGLRYADLDGLRGLLAVGVVLLHLGLNSFVSRAFGWPGMALELLIEVFFILSGFVLAHSVAKNGAFLPFAVRRVFRLAPLYLVTTLAAAWLMAAPMRPFDWLMAAPFVLRGAINFPAWSIAFEFWLPLAAVLLLRGPPSWAVRPLLAIAVTALAVLDARVAEGAGFQVQRATLGLGIGALLCWARLAVPGRPEAWLALLLAALALAKVWPPAAAIVPIAAIAAIISCTRGSSWLSLPPVHWLGAISYSLYLVHIPVRDAFAMALGFAIDHSPPAKLAILAASIAAAAALTLVIEIPANRLGHRLSRRIAAQQGLASRPAPTIAEP